MVYGKCLVSGQHVYITTTYPRFLVVSADMEATIRVPEDFEEAENCFIGKQEVFKVFCNLWYFSCCCLVRFSNGQLLQSAAQVPKFTLYEKSKDRTKKRRVMVGLLSLFLPPSPSPSSSLSLSLLPLSLSFSPCTFLLFYGYMYSCSYVSLSRWLKPAIFPMLV